MPTDPRDIKANPERSNTDTSLRTERSKADQQLLTSTSSARKKAARVVEVARERADDVLERARDKADETLRDSDAAAAPSDDTSERRAAADRTVAHEREAADVRLESEGVEHHEDAAQMLSRERAETDERLHTERKLSDRAVASRDDFLAMVSHDVRGILASLAMSGDLLMRLAVEGTPGERVRVEAKRIRRLTSQMDRLVGDLLDVVSMELGHLDVVPTVDDAARVLAETIEVFELTAAERGIHMTSEVAPGDLRATFDHDRILQVMGNLVGNSLKFTAPNGHIWLRVAPVPEGGIQFTVRDDGCGMPQDQIESMFERYSQAADRDRRGLGLGLFIARSIVEAHGGTIWGESEVGHGTAFHFTIPRAG